MFLFAATYTLDTRMQKLLCCNNSYLQILQILSALIHDL